MVSLQETYLLYLYREEGIKNSFKLSLFDQKIIPKVQRKSATKKTKNRFSENHQRGKSRWGSVGLAVDRSGRPQPCWHIAVRLGSTGRPPDKKQRAETFGRSTVRPTDKKTVSNLFSAGRPVGRPSDVHKRARPDTGSGRPVRSAGPA